MDNQQLSEAFVSLRNKRPLVHHITNYVTVNDCANITLCIGGAPVMADAPQEVEEMVSMAGSLVLNIGTLNNNQVKSMLMAGKTANDRGIPIVLDPVGAGATRYRTEAVRMLMDRLNITIIKGNAGEIGVLAGTGGTVRGVDSEGLNGDPQVIARELARSSGSIVIISGKTDIVSNGESTYMIDNGHELMGKISGTGCMATSIVAAFAAVSQDLTLGSVAALAAFGIAGENAALRSSAPSSFKVALLDETASLTPEAITLRSRVRSD
ncbi:MAG TPA: hydroxyethylthiazole kinase [Methanomassiliicoccales archaeon]|jgi:hydroxyethylthiazole kinase